jgi:hypothetical protein
MPGGDGSRALGASRNNESPIHAVFRACMIVREDSCSGRMGVSARLCLGGTKGLGTLPTESVDAWLGLARPQGRAGYCVRNRRDGGRHCVREDAQRGRGVRPVPGR